MQVHATLVTQGYLYSLCMNHTLASDKMDYQVAIACGKDVKLSHSTFLLHTKQKDRQILH